MRVLLAGVVAALAAVPAAGATPGFASFQTPSGNIGCIWSAASAGEPAFLRCDIRSRLRPKPPAPGNCDLDSGDSLELTPTGRTIVLCHGDTALDPRAPKLAYGRIFVRTGFRCVSRITGLTCTNAARHGFFLSRERWTRF